MRDQCSPDYMWSMTSQNYEWFQGYGERNKEMRREGRGTIMELKKAFQKREKINCWIENEGLILQGATGTFLIKYN